MQGEFEQKVQQKMEELQLTPSAPVWEKVELRIRPDKKRRRGLLWIPLIVAMLAGGSWWLYSLPKEQEGTHYPVSTVTKEQPPPTLPSVNTIPETAGPATAGAETIQAGFGKENRSTKPAVPVGGTTLREKRREASGQAGFYPEKLPANWKENTGDLAAVQKEKEKNAAASTQVTIDPSQQQPVKKNPVDATAVTESEQVLPSVTGKEDALLSKKTTASSGRKWKKQMHVQAGWNSDGWGQALVNPTQMQNAGTGLMSGFAGPQPLAKGPWLSAGFGLQREISARWQLSLGLQFSYFSTRMKVGSLRRQDSVAYFANDRMNVREFYANAPQNDYTNRFATLELPVTLHYRLVKSIPLHLSAGAAYGYLFHSNAMTYDPNSNIYYRNKENNNRHHLNLSSALQYRLPLKGVAIEAGPMVQYNTVPLQKEGPYHTSRLFFIGGRASVNF